MFRKLVLATFLYANCFGYETVTDPGSYLYYVEQIEHMTNMIQKMQQQVETLGGIKTATDDVKRQMYHVQDTFVNAMNNYVRASESLMGSIVNTPKTIDKLFSTDRDSITTSPTDGGIFYEDTAAFLDDIFKASETMPVAEFLHINDAKLRRFIKKDVSNIAWKRLFADQDQFKTRQTDRTKQVNDLMKKIQETTASDEVATVTQMQINTAMLLGYLIQTQTELLELHKSLAVAQALDRYEDVDFEGTKKKIETLNDEDATRRENAYKKQTPANPLDSLPQNVNINQLYGY
jgi:hypothetical protein